MLLMNNDRYNNREQQMKEAREKKRNRIPLSAKDYRHHKCFDIISIGDNEKLIHATGKPNSEVKLIAESGRCLTSCNLCAIN